MSLEIGQLLAGPFTGTILGYFGAEVIKLSLLIKEIQFEGGERSSKEHHIGGLVWLGIKNVLPLIFQRKRVGKFSDN